MTQAKHNNPETKIEIYQGDQGEIVFNVDANQETIWASQAQIANLFNVTRATITRHLKNIFADNELNENSVCTFFEHTAADGKTYRVKHYNLDAIISVGYRVNSKKATNFRIWATKTLKQYLTTGIVINQPRLKTLSEKKLKDVENMMGVVRRLLAHNELSAGEANGVLEVISKYAGSWEALEQFDEGRISFSNTTRAKKSLKPEDCESFITNLRDSLGASDLFGKKRDGSFDGILKNLDQSFDGQPLYKTTSEKASNLLYLVIKDHPFFDGNKRIASLLFIVFLTINNFHLSSSGETKISDRALTAIALLIAESDPSEKSLIIALICKLLEN
ncbi:MAG: RhuM family protein [Candidatus Saccharibacteria bacterium]|nr:RhuM family protein [Candidatus Saccharibacteria bacterium]